MNNIPLISLSGITKNYGSGAGRFEALKGIDLTVAAGEFLAVMGPSGSGKSTTMNIVGCLDIPTSGSYSFLGIKIESLNRNQRALLRRHYLGFIFQSFNLLPRTTALENVELPLVYLRVPARQRHLAAVEALHQVGLKGWEMRTPAELSGGQQQRVAIARAMLTRPALLLADEPTGNLDTGTSREILELIARFNHEHGITVLMVTHDAKIAACAERIIHFIDGRVQSDERITPRRRP